VRRSKAILVFLAGILAALPAVAGEHIVLSTGFRIYADRHETDGATIRLYNGASTSELPLASVAAIEPDDYVPPAPPKKPDHPAPQPARAPDARELVSQAALRHGLPPDLLHSVARVESGYRQDAVSSKGAMGIMQLMPETARELQADPADPEQNVDAGARYLRQLLLKYLEDPYQLRKALAAYNAGPAAVDRYGGVPPFRETRDYVRRVIRLFANPDSTR
jgi:soluble lytic murein transglycosylase-like protein